MDRDKLEITRADVWTASFYTGKEKIEFEMKLAELGKLAAAFERLLVDIGVRFEKSIKPEGPKEQ